VPPRGNVAGFIGRQDGQNLNVPLRGIGGAGKTRLHSSKGTKPGYRKKGRNKTQHGSRGKKNLDSAGGKI